MSDVQRRLAAALEILGNDDDPALNAAREALQSVRLSGLKGSASNLVLVDLNETEREVIFGFSENTRPRESVPDVLIGLTMMTLGGEGQLPEDYRPRLGRSG